MRMSWIIRGFELFLFGFSLKRSKIGLNHMMETPVRAEKLMISALNNFRTPGDDFCAFFRSLNLQQ